MVGHVDLGAMLETSTIMNRAKTAGFDDVLKKSNGNKLKFVSLLIAKNNGARLNSKTASEKTKQEHKQIIISFCNLLWEELGYRSLQIYNLKPVHIKAAMQHWESKGLSASSLQNYLVAIRHLCKWIGKAEICLRPKDYVSNAQSVKRIYVATENKSWDGREDVSKTDLLNKVRAKNFRVYLQLLAQDALGLRRKEAICFKPHQHIINGKLSTQVFITEGTKGGRPRKPFELLTEEQLHFVEWIKTQIVDEDEFLGDPNLSLKQNLKVYSNTLYYLGITKNNAGVTGHGLRAGFAISMMKALNGSVSIIGEFVTTNTPEEEKGIRKVVSEMIGHSRTSVTSSYYGPSTLKGLTQLDNSVRAKLLKAFDDLKSGAEYLIKTTAFTAENLVKTPARTVHCKFVETVNIDKDYFLKVIELKSQEIEHIPVDRLHSINLNVASVRSL